MRIMFEGNKFRFVRLVDLQSGHSWCLKGWIGEWMGMNGWVIESVDELVGDLVGLWMRECVDEWVDG